MMGAAVAASRAEEARGDSLDRRTPWVGVDLAEVAAVRQSLETFGQRYVGRIFTPHEAQCCRSAHDPTGFAVPSLAARFAAKEAALKVLRPRGPRPEWRSIEVRRHPEGWPELVLWGSAARLAEERGIRHLSLSLSHEGPVAAAVVVAMGDPDPREPKEDREEAR